ncbi:helix-turn-helix transcriptional regulator [Citromicrobium sp. WPS32]|uniref:helix-turn-helix transcriptional regulator n=1 Tax=Sphingomonadales TaxID=204457 RepID=UPI0006C8F8F5|nr:hypothetical protein WG75_06435 [Citromicrobium sp. WPS32]MAY77896.1 XRE family transcriptional regulator [Citromicrobium sp.]
MTGEELRVIRKGMGLSQHELAERLGVSRKTVSEWEKVGSVDTRTELAVRQLAEQFRSIHDYFRVEVSKDGRYLVVRSSLREEPHQNAMAYFYGLTRLYGVFARRDHAYRWMGALERCPQPRDTRDLAKERERDINLRSRAA